MSPKELIEDFYNSDFINDKTIVEKFFDKSCVLHWHTSTGFNVFDFEKIKTLFQDINKTYERIRFEISHLIEDKNTVCIRYTSHVTIIEDAYEEMPLTHFNTIWEVKNNKIVKGFQMSQMADASVESLNSFSK